MQSFVWKSDPISVRNGTVSVLAILETVAAVALSLWVGYKFKYWTHLIVSCSVAPLLLFRSEISNNLGIKKLHAIDDDKYSYDSRGGKYFTGIFLAIWALITLFLIRVYAVVHSLFKLRVKAFINIPKNWRSVALCVDLNHPPEAIGGIEAYSIANPSDTRIKELTISSLIGRYKSRNRNRPLKIKVLRTIVYSWVLSCLFIPSVVLRWSIKSSTLVYLPFIYFSKDIGMSTDSPYSRFNRIIESKAGLIWAVGGVWVLFTIVPIAFATIINTIASNQESSFIVRELLNYFTFVPTIERWNIVRLACATITIFTYIGALYCVRKYATIGADRLRVWDSTIKLLDLLRAIGIVYLALCSFLLLWYLFGKIDFSNVLIVLPKVGKAWLPINNQ